MMARRTAGRLGDGGGPGTRRGIFPRPRPAAVLGEAEVLEVGEGDAGHERVPVQAGPGAPLEAAEAQLPLELPVDRKSTRLNSSHANISYAVFCLKKKNINRAIALCV